MSLDRELQRALARKSPGPGFSERVLARIGGPAAARDGGAGAPAPGRSRRPFALRLGLGLALLAVAGGAVGHHLDQQRQGERARQQVMAAFQIAGAKVRLARHELLQLAFDQTRRPAEDQ